MTLVVVANEAPSTGPRPRRYDGKKVVKIFVAILFLGTIIASALAYFGHQVGAETRMRYEADRAH